MMGTILYGPRDVRCEEVPEPKILHPTDAVIRLSASCMRIRSVAVPRAERRHAAFGDGA
jgi:Alcohol dehydrogenase GroES-associated